MKTAAPVVSVVMPVYNGERFVREAVNSILGQTLKEFEFVIVDDASTDRTPDILQEFAARDSRLRVYRMTQNIGAASARNEGSRVATAGLIAVMDADDISLPHRLRKQVRFLEKHPDVGVLGSFVQIVDEFGSPGAFRTYPTTRGLTAWSLLFFSSIAHPTAMIRRSVVSATQGYSPDCQGGAEDFDLFTRASRVTRLANLPETLVRYRAWQHNTTKVHWHKQEDEANRIVGANIATLVGHAGTMGTAAGLRGLTTGRFPKTPREIRALGNLIPHLCEAFLERSALDAGEQKAVKQDAAVKVWLLAALAMPGSPRLSASLARKAMRLRPDSLPAFAVKALRGLVKR